VAEGHVLAAERGRVGEKYILGHENLELREIFAKLAAIAGRPAPTRRVPHWLPIAVGFVDTALAKTFGYEPRVPYDAARMSRYKMFFDPGKAVRELGLPQTPVDEPLRRAVTWFRQHGYVAP